MVGRLPAEPGRPRVGMAVGIDVVPPMDALGPTRTVDGLAVTPPPANCRPRVAAHDHRSRTMSEPAGPWKGRAGPALGRRADAEVATGSRWRARVVLVGVARPTGPGSPGSHGAVLRKATERMFARRGERCWLRAKHLLGDEDCVKHSEEGALSVHEGFRARSDFDRP